MDAQIGVGLLHGGQGVAHLGGIGDADGIAEADGLHAGVHVVLEEGHDRGGILVLALKGAAEGGGQVQHHVQIRVGLPHLPVGVQRLLVGAVDVGLVVAGAEGHHVADLAQAQVVGVGGAAHVGYQSHQVKLGILGEHILGDLGGVGQLGDGLGADKGGVLQVLHARVHQQVNDFLFQFGGDEIALDRLETVPGADFHDVDFFLFHDRKLLMIIQCHFNRYLPGLCSGKYTLSGAARSLAPTN